MTTAIFLLNDLNIPHFFFFKFISLLCFPDITSHLSYIKSKVLENSIFRKGEIKNCKFIQVLSSNWQASRKMLTHFDILVRRPNLHIAVLILFRVCWLKTDSWVAKWQHHSEKKKGVDLVVYRNLLTQKCFVFNNEERKSHKHCCCF